MTNEYLLLLQIHNYNINHMFYSTFASSYNFCYWLFIMRGSRSKAQQYGGERTLLYKNEIQFILNSLVNFALCLDPSMV